MITVIENESGFVIAYAQWDIVDASGRWARWGDYVCIREMWIHKDFRRSKVLTDLLGKMYHHPMAASVAYVYWEIVRNTSSRKIHDDIPRLGLTRSVSRAYHKDFIYRSFLKRSKEYATV